MEPRQCPICVSQPLDGLCPLCKGEESFYGSVDMCTLESKFTEHWKHVGKYEHGKPFLVGISQGTDIILRELAEEFIIVCKEVEYLQIKVQDWSDSSRMVPFPWWSVPKNRLPAEDQEDVTNGDILFAYVVFSVADKKTPEVSIPFTANSEKLIEMKNEEEPDHCVSFIVREYTDELFTNENGHMYVLNKPGGKDGLVDITGSRACLGVNKVCMGVVRQLLGLDVRSFYTKTSCLEGDGGIFGADGSFYGGANPIGVAIQTTLPGINTVLKSSIVSQKESSETNSSKYVPYGHDDDDDNDDKDGYFFDATGNIGWRRWGGAHSDQDYSAGCGIRRSGYRSDNYVPPNKKAYVSGPLFNEDIETVDIQPLDLDLFNELEG